MADARTLEQVKLLGQDLYSKRTGVLAWWQALAEQFYYERADFTNVRNTGGEMGTDQMTGVPTMARRNLGNAFGAMLRPSAKPWFKVKTKRPDREDSDAKKYLEWLTNLQRNAMYDSRAMLTRACKEADNDFATFGQTVIQCNLWRPPDGGTPHLLHRCWHLRDVAWMEDEIGRPNTVFRQWKPTVAQAVRTFRENKMHRNVLDKMKRANEVYSEVNCWHCIIPRDLWRELPGADDRWRQPFVSMWIDVDNDHIIEAVPVWVNDYVIPRWQTVSGSQYAHSPATVAGLPDARLLQAVTRVLLEAGEKAVNPPMIAVQDVVRGDIPVYAGGVTWVDADYDERTGEALRPMTNDSRNLSFGLELVRDLRAQLAEGFFLNKLNLPPTGGPDMTAYEVGQRIQEYIRNALPLFEPMEQEYNAQMCETDLKLLILGDPSIVSHAPPSMRGQDIEFEFESPLREAIEKQKVGQFLESAQIIAQASQLDPGIAFIPDAMKATRDTLQAVVPAEWLNNEDVVQRRVRQAVARQQQAELLALMEQGAGVAKTTSEATRNASQTLGLAAPAAAPTRAAA